MSLMPEDIQEPFKKRFKSQVTAADLCRVVIDTDSTDEEMSDDADDQPVGIDGGSEIDSSNESESELDDGADSVARWLDHPPPEHLKAEYREMEGLKVPPLGSEPRDFFNLMMNRSLYNLIIKNTNSYATRDLLSEHYGNAMPWKPLREDELKMFFGLIFLMDVVRLPNFKFYWSTDRLFNFPSFRQIMSMDRFVAILNALHFCDSSVSDLADPITKIRPLMEFFNTLMESIYSPQKTLIMSNPTTVGKNSDKSRILVFTLSERCGMVQRYLVNVSATGGSITNRHKRTIAARNLLEGKLRRGHSVFMGDYFTSVSLIQMLKAESTYATGQLRKRYCNDLTVTRDNEQVFQKFTKDAVCLLQWQDSKKNMMFVTSESLTKPSTIEQDQQMPQVLVEYKKLIKEETNRRKQLIDTVSAGGRKLEWYKRAGLHIINIILLNSYYLYSQYTHTKKMGPLKYKLNLIRTLLYSSYEAGEAGSCPENGGSSSKPHVLDYVGRNDKGFRKRKRCKYCISERGVRVDSYYHCITCDNQPGFCLGNCFIKYHKYDSIL